MKKEFLRAEKLVHFMEGSVHVLLGHSKYRGSIERLHNLYATTQKDLEAGLFLGREDEILEVFAYPPLRSIQFEKIEDPKVLQIHIYSVNKLETRFFQELLCAGGIKLVDPQVKLTSQFERDFKAKGKAGIDLAKMTATQMNCPFRQVYSGMHYGHFLRSTMGMDEEEIQKRMYERFPPVNPEN